MFGGGGGMDPRKLQQMMEQMGIDMEDIDAEEVIIRTPDEELVFTDAEVQLMAAQGQKTYQVVGEPESRPRDGESTAESEASETTEGDAGDDADESSDESGPVTISEGDIELVAMRAGVDEETARQALEDNGGDLADAVDQLE
ncbi:nascent polypeptide-associated complex protein [Halomicroarcula sp. GCM10025324]|uniref:nascent polypeptide-associated complex protein n=1 Tax=Haloarcula TaxID=2237 RepID=UPI0023E7AB43|nr:nascent polypeptide-associated complex protein [Halomicroarcula sp. ZS-22-S1]